LLFIFGGNILKAKSSKISSIFLVLLLSGCQTVTNSTTPADNLYSQYRAKPNIKAFSIGTNGVAGASWGASTAAAAIELAQKTCKKSGGLNCSVTEVNGAPVSNLNYEQNTRGTVNNFNIVSKGVTYKPDLSVQSTGIFVNQDFIVTTNDMVDDCSKISFEQSGSLVDTTVVRIDKTNNLVALKSSSPNLVPATIVHQKQTSQGERVYTYGYDQSHVVNSKIPTYQGKITDGIISSASGNQNDIRVMKITNELNRGNVGGPVMTSNGGIIGMVTTSNKEAVKSSMLLIFLNELNINYTVTNENNIVSPSAIAKMANAYSVPLVCLNEV